MNYFLAAQHGPKTPKEIRDHMGMDALEDKMNREILGITIFKRRWVPARESTDERPH